MSANRTFSQHGKPVALIPAQSLGNGNTETVSDLDLRGGFEWALVFIDVTTNNSTAGATMTVKSASESGGSYSVIEDDQANLLTGASNNQAVINVPASTTGVFVGEIDLRAHDKWWEISVENLDGGTNIIFSVYAVLFSPRSTAQVGNDLEFQIHSKGKVNYITGA